ncbi:unnamed protein product, partial [Allacma fusca]
CEEPSVEDLQQAFIEGVAVTVVHARHLQKRSGLLAIVWIFLICKILTFLMAIVLLHGSFNGRTYLLKIWLIFTSIQIIVWVFLAFAAIGFGISGPFLWVYASTPILIFGVLTIFFETCSEAESVLNSRVSPKCLSNINVRHPYDLLLQIGTVLTVILVIPSVICEDVGINVHAF